MNERYESINQLRFVYHNANDVCILHTFDILIIIMVVLKMLCDQKKKCLDVMSCSLLFIHKISVNVYLYIYLLRTYSCVGAINKDAELAGASQELLAH